MVELKQPPQVVFKRGGAAHGQLRALPAEPRGRPSRIGARAKRAGRGDGRRAGRALGRRAAPSRATDGRMDAYERLLGDAMAGDATLFARQDVVEAAWAIVDPVIHGPSPMYEYEPGTWGPPRSGRAWSPRSAAGTRRGETTALAVLLTTQGPSPWLLATQHCPGQTANASRGTVAAHGQPPTRPAERKRPCPNPNPPSCPSSPRSSSRSRPTPPRPRAFSGRPAPCRRVRRYQIYQARPRRGHRRQRRLSEPVGRRAG